MPTPGSPWCGYLGLSAPKQTSKQELETKSSFGKWFQERSRGSCDVSQSRISLSGFWCWAVGSTPAVTLCTAYHKGKNAGQFSSPGLPITVSGREIQMLHCVWELWGPCESYRVSWEFLPWLGSPWSLEYGPRIPWYAKETAKSLSWLVWA